MQATLKIADVENPGHFRSPSAKQHPHDKASGEYPEDRLQQVAPLSRGSCKLLRRASFLPEWRRLRSDRPSLLSVMFCPKTPHDVWRGVERCSCARCYRTIGSRFNGNRSRGWRASLAQWASATSSSSRCWNLCGLRLFSPIPCPAGPSPTQTCRACRRPSVQSYQAPTRPRACMVQSGASVISSWSSATVGITCS